MPTYHIEMLEGRTIEQKKKLVEEITRVTVEVLGGKPDAVFTAQLDKSWRGGLAGLERGWHNWIRRQAAAEKPFVAQDE